MFTHLSSDCWSSALYRALLGFVLTVGAGSHLVAEEEAVPLRGEVHYEPPAGDAEVAARFRLPAHDFAYEMRPLPVEVNRVDVWDVQFPSPVTSPHEANNTVHCEYFCPRHGPDRKPAAIVLHILGGDFPLSRLFCLTLAERGTAALFVKMPYYGPRRPEGVGRRMISEDPQETAEGMTQAILDIRQATAWLAARAEIDPQRLGVFGISLGGITGALAATAEPRLQNVCLLLAGGDIARVAWESRELDKVRQRWQEKGGTKEEFMAAMREIDPVLYGANVRGKRILMLNATEDEVIPRECTESLWRAFGEPEIHWYAGGHYSVARYIVNAMDRVGDFFEP